MTTDWTEINTDVAIQAFRDVERATLLLDRKKAALESSISGGKRINTERYFEATEAIRKEYEKKREEAKL